MSNVLRNFEKGGINFGLDPGTGTILGIRVMGTNPGKIIFRIDSKKILNIPV